MSFLWGTATSGHQVDGDNRLSDWWAWEQEGRCEGGARSGRATGHWSRFREDLRLAASLGLNSYRFSVEWARLEPEPGRWDGVAFAWYAELLAECEKLGLMPMLTLHHFTSPKWFADKGGFLWSEAPDRFEAFAREVVARLGSRVPLWCTINEPMVLAAGTYLGKFMPPATYSPDSASQACRRLLQCHVRAYRVIHAGLSRLARQGPWRDRPVEAGIAHNVLDFRPDRAWHPIERVLAGALHRFYNVAWLDAVAGRRPRFGVPGLIPEPEPVREALGRPTCEFIGINYYTRAYVQWRPRDVGGADAERAPPELPIGLSFARRKEEASDVGWSSHPEGLVRLLGLAGRYGLPLYITENGVADRDDRLRPRYLVEHLRAVAEARERGLADVRGYFHWSLLDNFEWVKGFGPRFGLFRVDYETLERRETESARLYGRIARAGGAAGPSVEVLRQVQR